MKKYIKDFRKNVVKVAPCVFCGKTTKWFFRKSYFNPYDKGQKYPICRACKDAGHTEEEYYNKINEQKPCKNHDIAFSNPNVPEAKNFDLKKCKKCGFYYGRM